MKTVKEGEMKDKSWMEERDGSRQRRSLEKRESDKYREWMGLMTLGKEVEKGREQKPN